jgi:hypothetical protein
MTQSGYFSVLWFRRPCLITESSQPERSRAIADDYSAHTKPEIGRCSAAISNVFELTDATML